MYCCNLFAVIVYVNSFCCMFFLYCSFVYENMVYCIMYEIKIMIIKHLRSATKFRKHHIDEVRSIYYILHK